MRPVMSSESSSSLALTSTSSQAGQPSAARCRSAVHEAIDLTDDLIETLHVLELQTTDLMQLFGRGRISRRGQVRCTKRLRFA